MYVCIFVCMHYVGVCAGACMCPEGGSQVQGKPVSTLLQGKDGLIPRSDFFFFFFGIGFFFSFFFLRKAGRFPAKKEEGDDVRRVRETVYYRSGPYFIVRAERKKLKIKN
jgi:hypothetical protein